jgi:hypothetical protein
MLEYEVRPLGAWLERVTNPRRGSHVFKASWVDTLDLLGRELEYLGARRVVLQVDVLAGDIRRDGMLRANARVGFPGVRVAFESKYGPLTYATDAHESHYGWATLSGWQANVRAVALGLEALRAVDRYGVTRRGEQYRGWAAIAMAPAGLTVDEAAELLARWAEPDSDEKRQAAERAIRRREAGAVVTAYKRAARRAHPDAGGDVDTFDRLTKARDLLEAR